MGGTDHLLYQMARNTLGRSMAAQGRYAEAEPLLRKSYEWAAENQPIPQVMPFMLDRLVALYEDWGRPAEADEYRNRRLEWESRPASD